MLKALPQWLFSIRDHVASMLSHFHTYNLRTQLVAELVRLLILAVAMSRTGLWTLDLAVTQLVQEHVPPHELGRRCCIGARDASAIGGMRTCKAAVSSAMFLPSRASYPMPDW
jgi:hypothetical protein